MNLNGMKLPEIALEKRMNAFTELGRLLGLAADDLSESADPKYSQAIETLIDAKDIAHAHNAWFMPENINDSLEALAKSLTGEKIMEWLNPYENQLNTLKEPLKVAVVMAGNIPLVGFHDFLCVLMSGNQFAGKLSSDDAYLLPAIAGMLSSIEPAFGAYIEFTSEKLHGFDAVIATGSNNTSRYFEYYFSSYPHIIRRNRNGIAVLDGNETISELENLGYDIFRYFGLGCRNVSKIYIPENYDFADLIDACGVKFNKLAMHHKYMNNYNYQRTIFMMNNVLCIDCGFFLLRESPGFISPISVINFEHYSNLQQLNEHLEKEKDNIQCILCSNPIIENRIPFGKSQEPELWDYADGVDTMKFLTNITKPGK
jgi:hypothetical protein